MPHLRVTANGLLGGIIIGSFLCLELHVLFLPALKYCTITHLLDTLLVPYPDQPISINNVNSLAAAELSFEDFLKYDVTGIIKNNLPALADPQLVFILTHQKLLATRIPVPAANVTYLELSTPFSYMAPAIVYV